MDGMIKESQQSDEGEEEEDEDEGPISKHYLCSTCVPSSTCLYVHHNIQTLDTQEATYADIAALAFFKGGEVVKGDRWRDGKINIH